MMQSVFKSKAELPITGGLAFLLKKGGEMKKILNVSCFTCLIVWIFLLFLANQSMADTYCVSNEANLIAALNNAEDNGSDDIIKIQQGTYNGNFVYAFTESFGLTIEGGYTAVCASRVVNPTNTILDGGGAGTVLNVTKNGDHPAATFVVDGVTLQNGERGGGFCPGGMSTLNNNAFSNNSGTGCVLTTDCGGGGGRWIHTY